ncbi:MAG: ERCC4 domain-containing protein, partial [Eubacterium sp.]|nr:ERCC4 domain-containing protein [Eubacterium sp.]
MILIDTREQKYEHVRKAFEEMGVPYDRTKLYVGDYTLVNDQSVCVDRKAGLHEVYSNLIQEHDRF